MEHFTEWKKVLVRRRCLGRANAGRARKKWAFVGKTKGDFFPEWIGFGQVVATNPVFFYAVREQVIRLKVVIFGEVVG